MFGYITVDKPEMKVKDFYRYKAYYCGLCKSLQENYGLKGRVTLSYDVTFLVLVLTSLYEPKEEKSESRCPVHPIKKIPILQNEISRYGADMNLLLTYYHFEDDWKDEKKAGKRWYGDKLKKAYDEVEKAYPRQCKAITDSLQELDFIEQAPGANADQAINCSGKMLSELCVRGGFLEQQSQGLRLRAGSLHLSDGCDYGL